MGKFILISLAVVMVCNGCASWGAASAEEYFSIGMAYFDIGKFAEAEKWLSRARTKDKTQTASDYNLGRIAFEGERYAEALKYFESVLKRDPDNVIALKAAAYTLIKNGDIEKAAEMYDRVLVLVPESADDGYNYALVLFAMKKYAEAEEVINNHEFALLDNNEVLLLYARAQKEQGKPEAIDNYAKLLVNSNDSKVRYEFAQLLEDNELYARALEEYRTAYEGFPAANVNPSKPEVRFAIARLLLIADSKNNDGITELQEAVKGGFSGIEKLEELLVDKRVSAAHKDRIRLIITEMELAAEKAKAEEKAKTAEKEKAAERAKAAAGKTAAVEEAEAGEPEPDDDTGTN